MLLFKNKKKQKTNKQYQVHDQLIKGIVLTCLRWQSRWAEWMQQKTEKLFGKSKLMMLLIFVSLTSGYNFYLIGKSFSKNQTPFFSIISIKKPAHIQETGDEVKHTNAVISKSEYERIYQFRQYMDSLVNSGSGKALHDSIVALRPGLMDSIQLVEKIYQSQIKK